MNDKRKKPLDPATANYQAAISVLLKHPIFAPLVHSARLVRGEGTRYPERGWAIVGSRGTIYCHPKRKADPDEWVYVLAHCLLHLGFGHFTRQVNSYAWNVTCDIFVHKFLKDLKIGKAPSEFDYGIEGLPLQSEHELYRYLAEMGVPGHLRDTGTGDPGCEDMIMEPDNYAKTDWCAKFGQGLRNAVTSAVNVAGGREKILGSVGFADTPAQRAKSWFINSYPLIGALVAGFDIIEVPEICQNEDIRVAAVDTVLKEIYINPAAGLTDQECRFVIAHEILHVGLRHDTRRQGRNGFLWNVACDYVINGWLIEIGLGEIPAFGGLYDPALKGESAEAIYDKIAVDLRLQRKLATLRGVGACDIIESDDPSWWAGGAGLDLDGFYRRCLVQGLEYHQAQGRGLLPRGMVEEIRSLAQPPIPWDVELAQWFDGHFRPVEKTRSYARPNRRQSSAPDIPRPHYVSVHGEEENRTFGVVLDTSGSMDRTLLAKALGAIASYAIARDVSRIRVLFCDAVTYDQGYMPPEALLERVQVKGRGGTVLQPAIDILRRAEDFPKSGPVLIVTDGFCDRLSIGREHAFLMPDYGRLPFSPRGKVFRIRS
jgi:predicted metal-dependent peptidase